MKVMLTFHSRITKKKKGQSRTAADLVRWEKIKWLGKQYFRDLQNEKKQKREAEEKKA